VYSQTCVVIIDLWLDVGKLAKTFGKVPNPNFRSALSLKSERSGNKTSILQSFYYSTQQA
jgi:hypothetical protein